MTQSSILTVNGGSSSVKFACFDAPRGPDDLPRRVFGADIERIGQEGTTLTLAGKDGQPPQHRAIDAEDHRQATDCLVDAAQPWLGERTVAGIAHRIVHGGMKLMEHQAITDAIMAELKQAVPLDVTHLPREIALIEAFRARFPATPHIACFDTAFHRDMPRVAKLLPIPREFDQAGVRRLGFHGLSYRYLMRELTRLAPKEAEGRVILAHLGSGASMAAVAAGKPVDTTMSFTPMAGLVMGTRPGDLDPGVVVYLMRTQGLSPEAMDQFISGWCGLLGVSETSSDMRDLIARRGEDVRAAEAVELFCYQARKYIGAFAAAMGGLDVVVFAGGIGEHSVEVRAEVCAGLEFLGVKIDPARNAANAPVVSADDSRVTIRVIPTDEEITMARTVARLLAPSRDVLDRMM